MRAASKLHNGYTIITLLDFSQKADLNMLAALVRGVTRAAESRPYLLAGATARDFLLHHAHDIELARATVDVDFAFLTEHWDQFHALRQRLLGSGEFSEVSRHGLHRLRFRNALDVDLLPFGEIEREDRTMAWPPAECQCQGSLRGRDSCSSGDHSTRLPRVCGALDGPTRSLSLQNQKLRTARDLLLPRVMSGEIAV